MKEDGSPVAGGCHDTPEEARAHLKALEANVPDANSLYYAETFSLADVFVATRPGTPYLWLPIGPLKKGDKDRTVTAELAAKFKLPHFQPPIKLGSHEETTPAGGHIVGFEVRADGIWVTPSLVPNGEKALADGAYKYHSPEIIWEDGRIQDPVSGKMIEGPFIMGDAFLHTPHLGERAALYSALTKENNMTETMTVPTSWFERLFTKPEPTQPDKNGTEVDIDALKVKATKADELQTELDTLKANATKTAQLTALTTELSDVKKYGALFGGEAAKTYAEHFSAVPEAVREPILQKFRAMSAQLDEAKLAGWHPGKTGEEGAGQANATELFDAAVKTIAKEKNISYAQATIVAIKEKKELFDAYTAEQKSTH